MKPNEWTPDLTDHIEQLLEESYAIQSAFSDFSIERVGQMIEEARESFENTDERGPEFLTEKASYEHCVEIYCNILMAIESLQITMPEETLGELSGRQQRTQFFQVPAKEKGVPLPPPLARSPRPTAPTRAPVPVPVPAPTPKYEDPLAGDEEALTALSAAETPSPSVEAAEEVHDIWSSNSVPAPELKKMGEDVPDISFTAIEDEADIAPLSLDTMPKTIFEQEAAPAPVAILEEDGPEQDAWEEKPLVPAAPTAPQALPPAPTALMSQAAQDYWKQAEHFKHYMKSGKWPLPQPLLLKLIGQSLCFSLESECAERLEPVLRIFWTRRESAIRTLLDNGNRKFELHPALKKAMDHAAEAHTEWLLEGKFPHAAVLSSLRYMMATLQPEKFQPSMLEAGIFVFFFGQDGTAEAFPLQNTMGVSGFTPEQATEFLFRLSRLHRLKNKFLSASGVLEVGQLLILEQDFETILTLLESLTIDTHALKEVA